MWTELKSLIPKALGYVQQAKANEDRILELRSEIERLSKEMEQYQNSITSLDKVLSVVQELISSLASSHMQDLEGLVTNVLRTVFFDRDYTFRIIVSEHGSHKQAEFFLQETVGGEVIQSSIRDGVGGGIQAVIGFVMQVFYIHQTGAEKVLFLDESFSQISIQYVDALISFLSVLCEQEDFKILFVTHDERFMSSAKQMIEVDRGNVRIVS